MNIRVWIGIGICAVLAGCSSVPDHLNTAANIQLCSAYLQAEQSGTFSESQEKKREMTERSLDDRDCKVIGKSSGPNLPAIVSQESSYLLCEKLAKATFAPSSYREAWAMELQRRGENCQQYSGTIAASMQQDQQFNQLANEARQAIQVRPPVTPGRVTGFLKRSYQSGMNRICIYDQLGSEAALTLSAFSICPLTN